MPTPEDQIRAAFERVAAQTLVNPAPSFKLLDRTPVQSSEEEPAMIELETPSHTDEHQKRTKRVLVAGLLAAAAVVAIALVGIRNDDTVIPADQPSLSVTAPATVNPQPSLSVTAPATVNPTDQPSPTVTSPVTVPPRALFGTPLEHFVPGTYYVDEVAGTATPRIFVTLGDGWTNFGDELIGLDGGGDARFSRAERVYADVCHSSEGFHPGPVTTLDGLVTALTEQQGWADVTAPTDVTVNGYAGKQFQRTTPADRTGCNTNDAPFRSWETDGVDGNNYFWYQAGDTETLLVLDVNGTIIIINTVTSDRADPAALPIVAAMLDSVRVEQIAAATSTPSTAAPVRDDMVNGSVDPDGDGASPLRVTYRVPTEGWDWNWFGAVKYMPGDADGITALSITTVSNLVTDGCRNHTPLDPPVGPTVDDLAIALSQLAPFEVTAPPTDVTLFGYQGKHLELTVPAMPVTGAGTASAARNLAKFTGCVEGELYSWISPINDRSSGLLGHSPDSLGAFNAYQAPGQTEEFWILDVGGTRVVLVKFDTPGAPPADTAERDAIFDSIRFS